MKRFSRRTFLTASAALTAAPAISAPSPKQKGGPRPPERLDAVIIGAGAAGIAAGRRLVAAGRRIERGMVVVSRPAETFVFENIAERPVLSLNRGFSAPITISTDLYEVVLAYQHYRRPSA